MSWPRTAWRGTARHGEGSFRIVRPYLTGAATAKYLIHQHKRWLVHDGATVLDSHQLPCALARLRGEGEGDSLQPPCHLDWRADTSAPSRSDRS